MGKGNTAQQTSIANSEQSFMGTLQNDFGTAFSGQQNILNGLNTALSNTVQAGPQQFGFTAPETSALNTTATSGIARALLNTKAAVGQAAAATSGGAVLPSGSQTETQAALEQNAAQAKSNALLGIQQAGYVQGKNNYNTAVSGEENVASLENPASLGGQANSASKLAFNQAQTIYKENQAASPWAMIGGLIGSLSSSAVMQSMGGKGGGGANPSQIGSAPGSAMTDSGSSMTGANDLGMNYGGGGIGSIGDTGASDLGGSFGGLGNVGESLDA